mmetsp:Transcript_98899/g.280143  ORF Transcript_98899/g.280143 Transcript_98899/m.280143 type:complete len:307 (+) Transcript_98899:392-1312(+)
MLSLNHCLAVANSSAVQSRGLPFSGRSQTSGNSRGLKGAILAGGVKPLLAAISWKVAQDLCAFRFQWHMLLKPTQHQFRSSGYLSCRFFCSQTRFQSSVSSHRRMAGSGSGAVMLHCSHAGVELSRSPVAGGGTTLAGLLRLLAERGVSSAAPAPPGRALPACVRGRMSRMAPRTCSFRDSGLTGTRAVYASSSASPKARTTQAQSQPQLQQAWLPILDMKRGDRRCLLRRRGASSDSHGKSFRSGSSGWSKILTLSAVSEAVVPLLDMLACSVSVKLSNSLLEVTETMGAQRQQGEGPKLSAEKL